MDVVAKRIVVLVCFLAALLGRPAIAAAAGTWMWPVDGPVIREFEPPDSPYGSGHRGIDIAAAIGTPVRAAAPGTVSFAGSVAGSLFVTVDHGGGLASTYSFLQGTSVSKGEAVRQGQTIASSGPGHPDVTPTHLHFGVKLDGAYVDPLDYLQPANAADYIHLAPIDAAA
jgi:murein DD-endopeptidase MepM/ murein hydrolase activator NlpD